MDASRAMCDQVQATYTAVVRHADAVHVATCQHREAVRSDAWRRWCGRVQHVYPYVMIACTCMICTRLMSELLLHQYNDFITYANACRNGAHAAAACMRNLAGIASEIAADAHEDDVTHQVASNYWKQHDKHMTDISQIDAMVANPELATTLLTRQFLM